MVTSSVVKQRMWGNCIGKIVFGSTQLFPLLLSVSVGCFWFTVVNHHVWVCDGMIVLCIQINRLCATVCVQDPSKTPNAGELDSMTLHTYIEQHAWTAGQFKKNL